MVCECIYIYMVAIICARLFAYFFCVFGIRLVCVCVFVCVCAGGDDGVCLSVCLSANVCVCECLCV